MASSSLWGPRRTTAVELPSAEGSLPSSVASSATSTPRFFSSVAAVPLSDSYGICNDESGNIVVNGNGNFPSATTVPSLVTLGDHHHGLSPRSRKRCSESVRVRLQRSEALSPVATMDSNPIDSLRKAVEGNVAAGSHGNTDVKGEVDSRAAANVSFTTSSSWQSREQPRSYSHNPYAPAMVTPLSSPTPSSNDGGDKKDPKGSNGVKFNNVATKPGPSIHATSAECGVPKTEESSVPFYRPYENQSAPYRHSGRPLPGTSSSNASFYDGHHPPLPLAHAPADGGCGAEATSPFPVGPKMGVNADRGSGGVHAKFNVSTSSPSTSFLQDGVGMNGSLGESSAVVLTRVPPSSGSNFVDPTHVPLRPHAYLSMETHISHHSVPSGPIGERAAPVAEQRIGVMDGARHFSGGLELSASIRSAVSSPESSRGRHSNAATALSHHSLLRKGRKGAGGTGGPHHFQLPSSGCRESDVRYSHSLIPPSHANAGVVQASSWISGASSVNTSTTTSAVSPPPVAALTPPTTFSGSSSSVLNVNAAASFPPHNFQPAPTVPFLDVPPENVAVFPLSSTQPHRPIYSQYHPNSSNFPTSPMSSSLPLRDAHYSSNFIGLSSALPSGIAVKCPEDRMQYRHAQLRSGESKQGISSYPKKTSNIAHHSSPPISQKGQEHSSAEYPPQPYPQHYMSKGSVMQHSFFSTSAPLAPPPLDAKAALEQLNLMKGSMAFRAATPRGRHLIVTAIRALFTPQAIELPNAPAALYPSRKGSSAAHSTASSNSNDGDKGTMAQPPPSNDATVSRSDDFTVKAEEMGTSGNTAKMQSDAIQLLLEELCPAASALLLDTHGCHVLRQLIEVIEPAAPPLAILLSHLTAEVVLEAASKQQHTRRVLQALWELHAQAFRPKPPLTAPSESAPQDLPSKPPFSEAARFLRSNAVDERCARGIDEVVGVLARHAVELSQTQQGCITLMRCVEGSLPHQRGMIRDVILPPGTSARANVDRTESTDSEAREGRSGTPSLHGVPHTPHARHLCNYRTRDAPPPLVRLALEPYGNYVVQSLLHTIPSALGAEDELPRMMAAVRHWWLPMSLNKFASNVVERLLRVLHGRRLAWLGEAEGDEPAAKHVREGAAIDAEESPSVEANDEGRRASKSDGSHTVKSVGDEESNDGEVTRSTPVAESLGKASEERRSGLTGTARMREGVLQELIDDRHALHALLLDGFGNFVLQALIETTKGGGAAEYWRVADATRQLLAASPYAHKIELKLKAAFAAL